MSDFFAIVYRCCDWLPLCKGQSDYFYQKFYIPVSKNALPGIYYTEVTFVCFHLQGVGATIQIWVLPLRYASASCATPQPTD